MKARASYFAIGVLLMGVPGQHNELSTSFLYLPEMSFIGDFVTENTSVSPDVTDVEESIASIPISETDLIGRLKEIFREAGAPPALVWIAEIESAMDYRARSRAGAVGMFQFMPETAERFGLTISGGRDERLDPAKSAEAAARYLQVLHEEFGSWHLAVAAYNVGEGHVRRKLAKHRASDYRTIERHLPYETQDYVERVFNTIGARERVHISRG
ncbi:MAG: lytic transglycosylase domain-containing protein [Kiritimatiellae bacterium]|nr:lytic transglycosylase domain-containing protein [Kiritimatiellia bacterium]